MLERQLIILMPEQVGMSLQILLSHLLIVLLVRLTSLSSLIPLGTTKFLYFQVGLFVKQSTPIERKGWFLCSCWECPCLSVKESWGNSWGFSSLWVFFPTWPALSMTLLHTHASVWEPIGGGCGDFYTWMGLLWSVWPWKSPGGESGIIPVQHESALMWCWALAALNPKSDSCGMWNMGPGSLVVQWWSEA